MFGLGWEHNSCNPFTKWAFGHKWGVEETIYSSHLREALKKNYKLGLLAQPPLTPTYRNLGPLNRCNFFIDLK